MQTERPPPASGFLPIPTAHSPEVKREVIQQAGQGTCCNQDRRNQPQANAIGAAALIFLSGGLHIAWSVGFDSLLELEVSSHLRISWFIAAIVGAMVGGFFSRRFTYKQLMIINAAKNGSQWERFPPPFAVLLLLLLLLFGSIPVIQFEMNMRAKGTSLPRMATPFYLHLCV